VDLEHTRGIWAGRAEALSRWSGAPAVVHVIDLLGEE
jgi:hypothetical protein